MARVENLHQSNPKTSESSVTRETKWKIATLFCSMMLHLQVTCEIPKSTSDGFLFVLDHMCKKQIAVSHSSVEFLSLFDVLTYGWIFSSPVWEWCVDIIVLENEQRKLLSVTNAKDSFPIHILTLVYLSPLTMFRPTFPAALIQPILHLRRQCGNGPKHQQKTNTNWRHVTRMHRVGLD